MVGKTVLKAIVTTALLFAVFRSVDISQIRLQPSQFSVWLWISAFSLLLVQFIGIRAVRWNIILNCIDNALPYSKAWAFAAISQFFNQILPSSIGGDGILVYLAHKENRPLTVAIHSVLIDRIIGTSALLALSTMTLSIATAYVSDQRMITAVIALSSIALGASLNLPFILCVASKFSPKRLVSSLSQFSASVGHIWYPRSRYGALMALCCVGHFFMAASVCLVANAFAIPISTIQVLLLLPGVFLLTIIPVSFGGWGVRETGMIVLLGYAAIPPADALTISVLYGLTELAVSSTGGIAWLLLRKCRDQCAERAC